MTGQDNIADNTLPDEVRIALAYASPADKVHYRALFELDRRLAEIVSGSSETMIGQLRLAWWRDTLSKPIGDLPEGEPLIKALANSWGHNIKALTGLVDGWESLLAAEQLDLATVEAFSRGREDAWHALARDCLGYDEPSRAVSAARLWSLADLASHMSDETERNLILSSAKSGSGQMDPLPKRLRPFAVLAALGKRAIGRGGRPLMEGRRAALVALRVGAIGR